MEEIRFPYDLDIYSHSLNSDSIAKIAELFLISSAEAHKLLIKNKVHYIHEQGTTSKDETLYFPIQDFSRFISFHEEYLPQTAILTENIYALKFHYITKIIPSALNFYVIEKLSPDELEKIIDGINNLLKNIINNPIFLTYLSRWNMMNPIAWKRLNFLSSEIAAHSKHQILEIKKMNFSLDIVNSTNNHGMDVYDRFYEPFQEVVEILVEKAHPNMIKVAASNLSLVQKGSF